MCENMVMSAKLAQFWLVANKKDLTLSNRSRTNGVVLKLN